MTNKSLLESAIKRSGFKKEYLAKELNITPQSLGNKISGRTEFTLSEVNRLVRLLNLGMREREDIFFTKYVL